MYLTDVSQFVSNRSTLYKAISGELLDLSVLRVSEIYKEFTPVSAPTICTMGIVVSNYLSKIYNYLTYQL